MAAHLYGNLPESRNKELNQERETAWSDIANAPPPPPPPPPPEVKEETKEAPKEKPPSRPLLLAPPPSVLKKRTRAMPVAAVTDVHAGHRETESTKLGYSLFGEIEDEYDPARPNDYEAVMEDRERKKHAADMEADKQELLLHQQQQEEEPNDRERKEKRKLPTIDEEDEAKRSERRLSADDTGLEVSLQPPQTGEGKGMVLAEKLLKKFGWKEGQGLGKERQGIATPLIAQKTDKHSAVIVKAEQIPKPETAEAAYLQAQVPQLKGPLTKVVLLRNLVSPGEVDDDLEEEVALELQKYGAVQKVLIFEVTESNFPPEEAVRIFVEFKSTDEAQKAAKALNGRFFGGRIVRAGYYNEAKFGACDLAPVAGEF